MSTELLERHRHRKVELEGSLNCRDLGGLRTVDGRTTCRGRVYRSDALATLTAEDQARLEALGIRAVFDLRTTEERVRAPNRLPAGPMQHAVGFIPRGNPEMFQAVNAGQLDVAGTRATMHQQYENLILDHTDRLARVYRGLLDQQGVPAIIHCASGKDRTGVVSAVLLLAVGVRRDDVLEDYHVSNFQRRPVDLFQGGAAGEVVEQIMCAVPEYLETALAAAEREFGSLDDYLRQGVGLSDHERTALADLLVE